MDPLARLAAALDPVMRTARTQGERVAVMRAAWAAAKLVLDAAPGPATDLGQRASIGRGRIFRPNRPRNRLFF